MRRAESIVTSALLKTLFTTSARSAETNPARKREKESLTPEVLLSTRLVPAEGEASRALEPESAHTKPSHCLSMFRVSQPLRR